MSYRMNDRYFTKHFAYLVKHHGGEWIVIAGGRQVAVGAKNNVGKMLDLARQTCPKDIPLVTPIPTEEEIQCIL